MPNYKSLIASALAMAIPALVFGQANVSLTDKITKPAIDYDFSIVEDGNGHLRVEGKNAHLFLRDITYSEPTYGTLFQWSGQAEPGGGPDLNEPLVTDRPDFTEASSTVGRGVVQIETGYTYFYDNDGGNQSIGHSYPETLFRVGILADWLEFRAAWNYVSTKDNGVEDSGANDLYLGFKIGLTAQDGIRPEMALIPQMTVPTGTSGFSNGEVLPGVNWLYGWDLTDRWSTAGSTQFNRTIDGGSGQAYTRWAQSWTTGYSLSDRAGAYAEWYALFPQGADTDRTEHYFNSGLTFLINDNMQFDVRAGKGLSDASADYFVGSGLSIRFR